MVIWGIRWVWRQSMELCDCNWRDASGSIVVMERTLFSLPDAVIVSCSCCSNTLRWWFSLSLNSLWEPTLRITQKQSPSLSGWWNKFRLWRVVVKRFTDCDELWIVFKHVQRLLRNVHSNAFLIDILINTKSCFVYSTTTNKLLNASVCNFMTCLPKDWISEKSQPLDTPGVSSVSGREVFKPQG